MKFAHLLYLINYFRHLSSFPVVLTGLVILNVSLILYFINLRWEAWFSKKFPGREKNETNMTRVLPTSPNTIAFILPSINTLLYFHLLNHFLFNFSRRGTNISRRGEFREGAHRRRGPV